MFVVEGLISCTRSPVFLRHVDIEHINSPVRLYFSVNDNLFSANIDKLVYKLSYLVNY